MVCTPQQVALLDAEPEWRERLPEGWRPPTTGKDVFAGQTLPPGIELELELDLVKNQAAEGVTLPPEVTERLLAELPVGGRTPLNAALLKADEVLRSQLIRDPTSRPVTVLITDGRANVALGTERPVDECLTLSRRLAREERSRFIIVDTEEQGLIRFGLAARLAEALQARYVRTADLKADTLLDIVKEQ